MMTSAVIGSMLATATVLVTVVICSAAVTATAQESAAPEIVTGRDGSIHITTVGNTTMYVNGDPVIFMEDLDKFREEVMRSLRGCECANPDELLVTCEEGVPSCISKVIGFRAAPVDDITSSGTAIWQPLKNWETSGEGGDTMFDSGHFEPVEGIFTSPVDAYYHVSALIRVNGLDFSRGGYITLRITIDGADNPFMRNTQSVITDQTLPVFKIVRLPKGSTIQVHVYVLGDATFVVSKESSLSVIRIEPSEGVSVGRSDSTTISKSKWSGAIPNWTVSAFPTKYFQIGQGFDEATGVYTAQQDGIFLVTANFRIDQLSESSGLGFVRLVGVVDGQSNVSSLENGVHSIHGKPASFHTMSIAGAIHLTKGQTFTFQVETNTDDSYLIQEQSDFAIARIPVTVGFMATKVSNTVVNSPINTWQPLNEFSTTLSPLSFLTEGTELNIDTALTLSIPRDGYYICGGNQRFDGGDVFVRTKIQGRHDGNVQWTRKIHSYVLNVPSTYFSLNTAGTLRMKKDDVIEFLYAQGNSDNLSLHKESSAFCTEVYGQ